MSKSGLCEVCQKRTTRRQWDEEQQEFYFIHEKCESIDQVIDFVFLTAAMSLILSDPEPLKEIAEIGHNFSELVNRATNGNP